MSTKPQSSPIGSIRTEISLPIFPLTQSCHVCGIYRRDPAVFDELSRRLILAYPRAETIRWLRQHGIKLTEKNLSRHYQRHVKPYVRDTLDLERRLRAELMVLENAADIRVGAVLARKLAADGLAAARRINLAGLLAGAGTPDEATSVLRELTRLCKALADIDRADAEIRLKEIVLKLRAIELSQKSGLREAEITRWIEFALQDHPDLAAQIIAIAKPTPALPAPAPGVEDQPPPPATRRRRPAKPAKKR